MTTQTTSLDGTWQFWKDATATLKPAALSAKHALKLQVPGPWQAHPDLRQYMGVGWYQRSFKLPARTPGKDCTLVHFGAVDYRAEVYVNGKKAGAHEGGYLPFVLDITRLLRTGTNTITVRVVDAQSEFPEVPHGKQSWYGPISGLWQSVHIEQRPRQHILALRLNPDVKRGDIRVQAQLSQPLRNGASIQWDVYGPDGSRCARVNAREDAHLEVPDAKLWDLDTPNLYTVRATLANGDTRSDTCGFRNFAARDGKLWLNERPLYLRSALDQDYYPDLIYTPPSLEYIEAQFRQAKALGLNNLRIHIKVGDPRYYIAADRVGILLWTEIPNWQLLSEATKQRSRDTLEGMVARDWNRCSIVIRSIINEAWGIDMFNPEHRQWLSEEYDFLKQLDPSRLAVDNSACNGNFHVKSDIDDMHVYYSMPDHYDRWNTWTQSLANRPAWTYAPALDGEAARRAFLQSHWTQHDALPATEVRRTRDEPLLVSEFGNWGLPNIDQLLAGYGGKEPWWFETGGEWGNGEVYPHGIQKRFEMFHLDGVFGTLDKLTTASQRMQHAAMKYEIERMREQPSIQGYVITEFTDVHWECNGLLDMHRNPKAYFDFFHEINADDVLVPHAGRVAYWSGEQVNIGLSLSHYSQRDLDGSTLHWRVHGHAALKGAIAVPRAALADVTGLAGIAFRAPAVTRGTRTQIILELRDAHGQQMARNVLELVFLARPAPPPEIKIYAPELGAQLKALGYRLVNTPIQADVVVTTTLTEALREHALAGGRVLFLAERDDALQTHLNFVGIASRNKSGMAGDWASNMNWLKQGPMFKDIPTDGLMTFAFADLTPEHVITGIRAHEYADSVHAGMFLGWIHRNHALIHERGIGRGRIMISTLRLSENVASHPLARCVFDDLLIQIAR